MSQSYVPDGTLVTCSEGKVNTYIYVVSQNRIYMNGKLKATENDRFKGNFHCSKMVKGPSLLEGMVGAAIDVLGFATNPSVSIFAGQWVRGIFGTPSSNILPNLCSTLCSNSSWTVVHPKVYLTRQHALLEKARLRCTMGGLIQILLPNMTKAITYARLAQAVYQLIDYENPKNNEEIDGFKPVDAERAKQILGDEWKKLLDQDEDNGFYSTLYEDKNGNVVIAYRGTDVGAGINDILEDVYQAMGVSSDQYDASVKLSDKIQEAKNNGYIKGEVIITGHSLGGGLATIAGAKTGYPTYTYNAAAVNDKTYKRNQMEKNTDQVQAYIGTKDPLNAVQDNREVILSGAVLLAPSLPVIGGIGGAGLGPFGLSGGSFLGGLSGEILSFAGNWAILTGGLPRQTGVQRILVPQDNNNIIDNHSLNDLIRSMEKMKKSMDAGNPVLAEMNI